MKILLDSCVWGGACSELVALGHDAVWTGAWPRDPGDEEILRHAHAESRILVTLDKDFGELAVAHAQPHSGILRLVGFSATDQALVCESVLSKHGDELLTGAIITAEPARVAFAQQKAEPPLCIRRRDSMHTSSVERLRNLRNCYLLRPDRPCGPPSARPSIGP